MSDSAHQVVLTSDALRRLLVSLIVVEQAPRLRAGAIGPEASLERLALTLDDDGIDGLSIDEDALGFDSLARLDLILRVNRFFGLHATGVEDYLLVHRRIGEWIGLIQKHFEMLVGPATFTFETSGSSGPPKQVAHDLTTLSTEVAALSAGPLSGLDPQGRILALVPPHHIFGFLFTCLLPSLGHRDVVDLHRGAPGSVFSKCRPGDLVIATPYIWGHLAAAGMMLPTGVSGVTSGGPSEETTWTGSRAIGLSSLVEVYGATETGGIGTRQEREAPYRLLPHLIRAGEGIQRGEDGPQLDLQDRLAWEDAERFRVLGRRDDKVQVAGVNVSPVHVAETIRAVDGVDDLAVRFDDGRLRALVVPRPELAGDTAFEARLRKEIASRLAPAARPSEIIFADVVPRSPIGKLMDWA